jgi:hypothetical protein
MQHSDKDTVAIDLARLWAPILMRHGCESNIMENKSELQIRVIQTLITSAQELFDSDPTERYADSSFSSVTLMPNFRQSVILESEHSGTEWSSASALPFHSLWQSEVSSIPHVVTTCTLIIESNDWRSQIYYIDVSESEVKKAMSLLMSRKSTEISASY